MRLSLTSARSKKRDQLSLIARLQRLWCREDTLETGFEPSVFDEFFTPEQLLEIDRFDQVQLAEVISVCRKSKSLSDAGRILFAASRARRKATNDSDRVRKYLAKFHLDWDAVQ